MKPTFLLFSLVCLLMFLPGCGGGDQQDDGLTPPPTTSPTPSDPDTSAVDSESTNGNPTNGNATAGGAPAPATPQPAESRPDNTAPSAGSASPRRTGSAGGSTQSDDFSGIVGMTQKQSRGTGIATVAALRTGRHEHYDRVVFEFESSGFQGYQVDYVDAPAYACGSGEALDVPANALLRIHLFQARAHSEAGHPTVRQRDRDLPYQTLKALRLSCDFEAQVTWVLGLDAPNPYRILELQDPPRLVLDVKH